MFVVVLEHPYTNVQVITCIVTVGHTKDRREVLTQKYEHL